MTNHFFKLQDVKDSKKLNSFLKKSQKELSSFFGVEIYFPSVFFINSRKQYDDVWKIRSKNWMVGGADGRKIFILDPEVYTIESDHEDIRHFWQTLKHEYCHIAIRQFYKQENNKPKWLNEGLCCYLASQVKRMPTKKEALKVFDYYSKADWRIYAIGYFWTKLLIDKFGKRKLLQLLRGMNYYTTEKEFSKLFYGLYKIRYVKKDFSELFDNLKMLG